MGDWGNSGGATGDTHTRKALVPNLAFYFATRVFKCDIHYEEIFTISFPVLFRPARSSCA